MPLKIPRIACWIYPPKSRLVLGSPARPTRSLSLSTVPSILEWIKSRSSSPPTNHYDTLDPLRASHLLRTLPTRQHLSLSQLSGRSGDELVKGGHMIYFQPETALRDLGPDGSSPVSHSHSPFRLFFFHFLRPITSWQDRTMSFRENDYGRRRQEQELMQ